MKNYSKILLVLFSICLLSSILPVISSAASGEAYAVYNDTDKTLTFCVGSLETDGVHRDTDGEVIAGTNYYSGFLSEKYDYYDSTPWHEKCSDVIRLIFTDPISPLYTKFWFCDFSNLNSIDGIANLKTNNVTDMSNMFMGCSSLESLDLSGFNTQNVTDMDLIFFGVSVSSLTLGENFSFVSGSNCYLIDLTFNNTDTGFWILEGNGEYHFTSSELVSNYDGATMAGTWIRERTVPAEQLICSLSETNIRVGETCQVYSTIYPENATNPDVHYYISGGFGNAEVDYYTGVVTGLAPGSFSVSCFIDGPGAGDTGVEMVFGRVLPQIVNISNATVIISNQTYNGEQLRPVPTVKLDDKILEKNTDYYISEYNDNINVGTATITISGKGNYEGTITKSFSILPKNITDTEVFTFDQEYSGEAINASITAISNGKILSENTDYTVEYADNINVGTASITITGIGNYTGFFNVYFEITAKDISSAVVTCEDKIFTGNTQTTALSIILEGIPLTEGTDFITNYENNINAGTAKVSIVGIGNYQGTISGTFTIQPRDLSTGNVIFATHSNNTTGEKYSYEVILENTVLIQDSDYKMIIEEDKENNILKVTVTGIGNYDGQTFGSFEIKEEKSSSLVDWIKSFIKKLLEFFKKIC